MASNIAYPDPTNIKTDKDGLFGEKTFTFTSNGISAIAWKDNVTLLKVNAGTREASQTEHEKIVLNSGAVYGPVDLIGKENYESRGIEDIFGDDQLCFICVDGLFITRKQAIVTLLGGSNKGGIAKAQEIE